MQQFSSQHLQKFKDFFHIQKSPWEIEQKLWKKCETYIPFLRFIPWILFVWVGNSLSMNTCHKGSDIDLFIITRKNRLWTVRILVTLYFTLLGQRKTKKKHAGKFCLSFFITEDALSFGDFAIPNDIYLYFWVVFLKPLITKKNIYERFLAAQKSWVDFSEHQEIFEDNKKYLLPQESPLEKGGRKKSAEIFFRGISFSWDILEIILKKVFLPRTKKSFEKLGKPFGVIISDDVLKFHDKDRRKEMRESLL